MIASVQYSGSFGWLSYGAYLGLVETDGFAADNANLLPILVLLALFCAHLLVMLRSVSLSLSVLAPRAQFSVCVVEKGWIWPSPAQMDGGRADLPLSCGSNHISLRSVA